MNTLEYLNKLSSVSLASVRAALYALSVKTGYDQEGRMILFPEARGENVIGEINNESNGLVIHIDEKESKIKCLAIPMPFLRHSTQMRKDSILAEWTENTKVYKCQEGTNITLYWFKDRWCIATAKGIEVNNIKWNEGKTYQEMVFECANHDINEYIDWNDFCSHLDKSYSYAFGFWHPDFHVFQNDQPSIWINRITNNKTFKDVTDECKLSFKVTKSLEFKENEPSDILTNLHQMCDRSLDIFLNNDSVCLGYMLRNTKNGDILIESALQKTINNLYYHAQYTKSISQTSYTRHNYVLLANYVSGDNKLFMNVFPRFADEFERFDKEIVGLINALELLYRKAKQSAEVPLTNKYLKAADEIKKNIDQLIKVNIDDKLFRTTIISVLYHPNHFDTLYRLLF